MYGAYLSLLYAVRGATPGEQLPLRYADLEALLLIVGDDPKTIEQGLIALMGCTPEAASALRAVLLRHRRLAATPGGAGGKRTSRTTATRRRTTTRASPTRSTTRTTAGRLGQLT